MRELNAKERKSVRSAYLNPKDYLYVRDDNGGIWIAHRLTGARKWTNTTQRSGAK